MNSQDKSERLLDDELALLSGEYQKLAQEVPPSHVDRAILDYAKQAIQNERELLAQNRPRWNFWRRLELPVFALSLLTATALAMHWLLPTPPVATSADQEQQGIDIEVRVESEAVPNRRPRQRRELPAFEPPIQPPDAPLQRSQAKPVNGEIEKVTVADESATNNGQSLNAIANDAAGGAQQQRLDRQQWLQEIKRLMIAGRMSEARQQVREFKLVYPDYPIDEELAALR